ncbi:hypothetical protein [Staphylococcus kloosii]
MRSFSIMNKFYQAAAYFSPNLLTSLSVVNNIPAPITPAPVTAPIKPTIAAT